MNIQTKSLMVISVLLLLATNVSAVSEYDNDTLTIWNASMVTFTGDADYPVSSIICEYCVGMDASVDISGSKEYSIDYVFRYAHNTTDYQETIYTLKQNVTSSYWGLKKTLYRRLSINGIEVGAYNCSALLAVSKPNSFEFDTVDQTIFWGNKRLEGQTVAFTQITSPEAHTCNLAGIRTYYGIITRATIYDADGNLKLDDSQDSLQLKGFTGLFLNVIRSMPFGVGESLYGVLYKPLLLIQYIFDFSFTFIDIIINDWWYALLVFEIMCIIPALQYTQFPDIVGHYIDNHVKIIMLIYHKIIIPLVEIIVSLLRTIRG
jgi:hypothetical protein